MFQQINLKTFFALVLFIAFSVCTQAQPSKKDMKEAESYMKSGKSELESGGPNCTDCFKLAMQKFTWANNRSQGTLPGIDVLYAKAVIKNHCDPASWANYYDLAYYPNYKQQGRDELINPIESVIKPLLLKDSSHAEPYLALAVIHLMFYYDKPDTYMPYYNKAVSLGNCDKEYMELYNKFYNQVAAPFLQKQALHTNSLDTLEQLLKKYPVDVVTYKLAGINYAKQGYFDKAFACADSIKQDKGQYLSLLLYICQEVKDPKEKFRLYYTYAYKGYDIFFQDTYPYYHQIDTLLSYAGDIEHQFFRFPFVDEFKPLRYADIGYYQAKDGNYYTAFTFYQYAFENVVSYLKKNHAYIGYHYNRALALAMMGNGMFKKQAISFIDTVLTYYKNDPATVQLETLKKKIVNNEKLLPSMFVQKPAYYDEIYAIYSDGYNKRKREQMEKPVVKTEEKKVSPECTPPVFNNEYLEKMNKQAQNDINNWNSVTKYGQENYYSPSARSAISRITSTYREIELYYLNIKDQAIRSKRNCKDKSAYAAFDEVIRSSQEKMDQCVAQVKKWNETTVIKQ